MILNPDQLFRELNDIKNGQTTAATINAAGFQGVHDRLDILNGRTRKLEIQVAIMRWALATIGGIVLALIPTAIRAVIDFFSRP